jgi:hypothetical protein
MAVGLLGWAWVGGVLSPGLRAARSTKSGEFFDIGIGPMTFFAPRGAAIDGLAGIVRRDL